MAAPEQRRGCFAIKIFQECATASWRSAGAPDLQLLRLAHDHRVQAIFFRDAKLINSHEVAPLRCNKPRKGKVLRFGGGRRSQAVVHGGAVAAK